MTRRLQPWICLSLLLIAACGRPEKTDRREDESARPDVMRSSRPPRGTSPEPLGELRAELVRSETLTDPVQRDKVLAQVAWNALELDPELAREAFDRLGADSPERIALVQHFAMRMADEDPAKALEWAASLDSEREAAAARVRIALVVADADPAKGAELLSEFGLANREFEVAVVQVLQRWSGKSPQDAAAWVEVFPAGKFRKAGMETVASGWLASDPQAAFGWLAGLGDEGIRADAGDAFVKRFLQQTRETRESWLNYADPQIREKLVQAQPETTK